MNKYRPLLTSVEFLLHKLAFVVQQHVRNVDESSNGSASNWSARARHLRLDSEISNKVSESCFCNDGRAEIFTILRVLLEQLRQNEFDVVVKHRVVREVGAVFEEQLKSRYESEGVLSVSLSNNMVDEFDSLQSRCSEGSDPRPVLLIET